MNKLLLVLASTASLGLVACNGGSSNPTNSTPYGINSAQLTAASGNPGCTVPAGSTQTIQCSFNNGGGYSGVFTYTFASSNIATYLDLVTAKSNAANANPTLNNVTLNQVGGDCGAAQSGSYTCTFSIQGAAGGNNNSSFQIPVSGSLGAVNYITVNVN